MGLIHHLLSGTQLHEPFHFVQEDDPGAVGAAKYWLKLSTGVLKRRAVGNASWTDIILGTPGADGEDGTNGTNGTNGTDGEGVPIGGTTNQILKKNSATDFDVSWDDPAAGVSAFTDLTDGPGVFTGQATKSVRVNPGETALEYYTPSVGGSGPPTDAELLTRFNLVLLT